MSGTATYRITLYTNDVTAGGMSGTVYFRARGRRGTAPNFTRTSWSKWSALNSGPLAK